jgi:hypothetical protein
MDTDAAVVRVGRHLPGVVLTGGALADVDDLVARFELILGSMRRIVEC